MAGVIDLRNPSGPTVEESAGNITRVLELVSEREKIRQSRKQLNDFVTETIRLTGTGLEPDLAAQQAAVNITKRDPTFDPGLLGGFQRFASGIDPGPSTTLTEPIANKFLADPTGIDRERIKAGIEASEASVRASDALADSRKTVAATKPGQLTDDEKTRDRLASIIGTIDRSKNPEQKSAKRAEALKLMSQLPKESLLALSGAESEDIDTEFSTVMKGLSKKLRINTKGNVFNEMWGETAFDRALRDAQDQALSEGVDPDTVQPIFEKWWDFKAQASGFKREFQPRSEFQDINVEAAPGPDAAGPLDIKALSDEALQKLIEGK